MDQPITASPVLAREFQPLHASTIPKLSRDEVIPLAREELARFLALIQDLSPSDWDKPTDCSLWTVKDIVAHQASHVLALTDFREFLDQFLPFRLREYTRRGMNSLDAANQRQVEKRVNWTPAQLITEIRDNSEKSFVARQRFPLPLRWMRFRTPGYDYSMSMGELIDNIFTRDMWMHRLDISRATGREMAQTHEYDGRITALVIRDLDQHLRTKLTGSAVIYHVYGKAGGEWQLGGNNPASASIILDVLDLHRIASGRLSGQQAIEGGLVKIEGDHELAERAVQNTVVLY
jgi:uncharacterized protein (TIGR03083 family)